MLKIFFAVMFVVLMYSTPSWALSLKWDAVTTDVDGQPLSPGNEVQGYVIYRCQSNTCSLVNGSVVAVVPVPDTTFNIDAQPRPSTYFVTPANLSGQGAESNTVRVTPPRKTQLNVESN